MRQGLIFAVMGAILTTALAALGVQGAPSPGSSWPAAGGLAAVESSGGEDRALARADTVDQDTAQVDTTRNRILERARERSVGRAEAPTEDPAEQLDALQERGEERALGAGAPEPADSVMEALYGLEGFDVLRFGGESADFSARDGQLFLWGAEESRAQFFGEGMSLEADSSIVYDDAARRIWTVGESTFRADQGDPVDSRVMVYDLTEERGTALGARTEYTEDATWYVEGDLTSLQRESSYGREISFTSCELEEPHYHFRTDQFKILPGDILVARSVRMYFGDVAVAWLPFIAQSLEDGRQSGLLTPRFSTNDVVRTSSDHNRRVDNIGFYWAMSEYSDALMAFQWFSDNYIALDGGLQYRWQERFLDGNVNVRRYWRAEGGRDFSLNTRHNWEYDERTRINVDARYHSSSQLIRETTTQPRDVTQTVDSNAGVNRRFDWGTLSMSANRQQDLNTDRVTMTLPSTNLSLSSQTLFGAPPAQASWYNNLSLRGSADFRRRIVDNPPLDDPDEFTFGSADKVDTRGRFRGSLGMGAFSLGGGVTFNQVVHQEVPDWAYGQETDNDDNEGGGSLDAGRGGGSPVPLAARDVLGNGASDVGDSEVDWNVSASYQYRFFGATTFSPSVSLEGRYRQVDTLPAAENFVQGPTRLNLGASVQTEIYGFFPGPGSFETLRHKLTPRVSYNHSPSVEPTALQEEVFGVRDAREVRTLTVGVNQSFEAKRPVDDDDEVEDEEEPEEGEEDPDEPEEVPEEGDDVDALDPDADPGEDDLEQQETGEVVNLLSLRTSAVTYDLVEADETGRFLDGFTTTVLRNTVDSDYLQGLSLRFQHDLFDHGNGVGGEDSGRRFSPHLSSVNLGFAVDDNSSIVGVLERLLRVDDEPDDEEDDEPTPPEDVDDPGDLDPDAPAEQDPGAIDDPMGAEPAAGAGVGQEGWRASFDYTLRRPRDNGSAQQMLRANLGFSPSPNWSATWYTNLDLESGEFVDHSVNLTRDLHRWQATFSFNQTATGNWSFRFEVTLLDNRDIEFDFEQRDLGQDRGFPGAGAPGPGGGPP